MKPTSLVLLVPLALASFAFSAMPPQQAPVWRQSQKSDAARGITFTRFALAGKFQKSPPDSDTANRPAIVLDCIPGKGSHPHKGRFLAGNFLVGTGLKIDYVEPEEIHGTSYFPMVAIQYRLDDAKEEREKWSAGTDKTSASIPAGWLKKMLRAHSVELTAADDHGSPLAMHFDIPDPTPVEQGCGMDERKK